jgi:hypothetical protein
MNDDLSRRINAAVYIFGGTPHGDFLVAVRDEIERLRAENDRLREALEKIASLRGLHADDIAPTTLEIARAALEEEEK